MSSTYNAPGIGCQRALGGLHLLQCFAAEPPGPQQFSPGLSVVQGPLVGDFCFKLLNSPNCASCVVGSAYLCTDIFLMVKNVEN